jgi:hypothetical protein
MQAAAVEGARQRLDAEMPDQGMRLGRPAGPEHGAKAARIAHSQNLLAENDVYMVMLAGLRAWGDQAQAARHPQVQDQMAAAAVQQQILASTADRPHLAACKRPYRLRHAPAQAWLAHRNRGDRLTYYVRGNTPARDFDFREFRHGSQSDATGADYLVRGTKYTYTACRHA